MKKRKKTDVLVMALLGVLLQVVGFFSMLA
jgi:hypothetical protein